jgi:hypothetical protein
MVAILVFGGFYIPGLRSLWTAALKTLLSEKVLARLFVSVAETLVKSTKNKLDDVWLEELKKSLGMTDNK